MHIEPGLVDGAKIGLSYATATCALGVGAFESFRLVRSRGVVALLSRSAIAIAAVFVFFQVFPHTPVGVSEVHLILGSTLFLLFGVAPAAIGLAGGLLIQGLFFAPFDLPQYGMNVTTLLVPLFGVAMVARKVIAPNTPYVKIRYRQALALSSTYQAGIVAWVGFWALYGGGVGAENLASVASFSGAYLLVILVEPLADLAVLAGAKSLHRLRHSPVVDRRLFNPA
ncbi:energy-coupling factor ABC transporter permease [Gordonia jinhuaensis]|uniref:Cobalt transporter n=1 Tax=Gordonia jinhuaensis TaxID=1517702 RepID=A0A916TGR1_9ACTN|nr:energy-coupling factor ABC transporter permease [Gordonia jinhuaensis]GGB44785.1 cobalt transporter [Gordonia jinhuaensis]